MILSELIDEYISGDWGNEEHSDDTPNAVTCIRAADFVPILSIDYTNIPTRYICDNSFENKLLKVGDIVIEKSGGSPTQSTGRVIIITEELLKVKQHIVCSNFCEAFRVKEGWNPYYVFSYLQFLYNEGIFFNFEGKTSGLKNLQMDQAFSSIDIPKQKCDISILAYIDEKIALNRKINIELEALAKQIYDYWFVQFDFPNEEGKPYKSSGGKMVWNKSLKREIPEGWSDDTIDNLTDINDASLTKEDILKNLDYLDTSNLNRNCIGETITYDRDTRPSRAQRKVKDKTILFSTVRPALGHYGILLNPPSNIIVSTGFATLDAKDKNDTFRIYMFLTSDCIVEFLAKFADTAVTSYPSINPSDIGSLSIVVPPRVVVNSFNSFIEDSFKIISKNSLQIKHLQSLRSYLLPLLMNGQITIKD